MTQTPRNRFSWGNFLYESSMTGAVGGSVVALTFLFVDSVFGRPFYTPSVLGEALFFGTPPAAVHGWSIKAAAWFTPVHFALFLVVGAVGAVLVRTMERTTPRPFWVTLVLFCITEGGFLFVGHFFLHGVTEALGRSRVAGVNLFAAICMVWFLHSVRREEAHMDEETASGELPYERAHTT